MNNHNTLRVAYVRAALLIKDNYVIRKLMSPFVKRKRLNNLKSYQKSDDSVKISTLQGKFYGKKCYIIGNGPSLTVKDLELIKNEYTFAANRIYTLFDNTVWRPTFYTSSDSEAYKLFGNKLNDIEAEYLFYDVVAKKYMRGEISDKVYFFCQYAQFPPNRWDSTHPFISEDISKMVSVGMTVTFTAIQLAIYMGFKEIYLLGVDHFYSRQITKEGKVIVNKNQRDYGEGILDSGISQQYVDLMTEAFEVAQNYCRTHDIAIYNATRGGKLEIFPRVKLEDTL